MAVALALGSQAFGQQVQPVGFRRPATIRSGECCPPTVIYPSTTTPYVPGKIDPKVDPKIDPKMELNPPVQAPVSGIFGEQARAGGSTGSQFNPAMFGDILALKFLRGTTIRGAGSSTFSATQIITSTAAIKVSDNESPRPQDRVYFSFHYFDGVRLLDTTNPVNFSVTRQTLGFEKTFLDGNASFGLRVPFQQLQGDPSGTFNSEFGDLTITTKFAWINNYDTGNVFSTGLLITLPTGEHPTQLEDAGISRNVILQPWGGWIYNADRFYAMGFHSFLVPTDPQDLSFLANDLSAGVWLMRDRYDRFLRGVAFQTEVHVLTPLDHRSPYDTVYGVDQVTLTNGFNWLLGRACYLNTAVAIPVAGPRIYDYEGIVQLNFRF